MARNLSTYIFITHKCLDYKSKVFITDFTMVDYVKGLGVVINGNAPLPTIFLEINNLTKFGGKLKVLLCSPPIPIIYSGIIYDN